MKDYLAIFLRVIGLMCMKLPFVNTNVSSVSLTRKIMLGGGIHNLVLFLSGRSNGNSI